MFGWRGFASAAECDQLVAHGQAAAEFATSSGSQMVYGVEGFSRVLQMNGKVYADVSKALEELATMDTVAQALVERFDRKVAEFMNVTASDEQWQSVVHCTPMTADAAPGLLNGLHVDTFNNAKLRFATSLLYLKTIERGGETLFSQASDTGASLLENGIESTLQDDCHHTSRLELEADCRALVPPAQGTLLLFYVRRPDGHVDPAAFHGSARPLSCDKWTLQTFWAAPVGACPQSFARQCHAQRTARESPK